MAPRWGRYRFQLAGESLFRRVLTGEDKSCRHRALAFGAAVAAFAYGLGVRSRNLLFDRGRLRQVRARCPVISVGNITLGGTGKTPIVCWLARSLRDKGWRPAVVSRGYGGNYQQEPLVVSDGERILAGAGTAGDEPHLLAQLLPGVAVLCARQRIRAAVAAVELFGAEVIILDDGFQHRSLARDLDVVLVDAHQPFGNGALFPRGLLREPVAGLKRAHALICTRFDGSDMAQSTLKMLRARWPGKLTVACRYQAKRVVAVADGKRQPLRWLRGRRVAAFAGIARPDDFFATLEGLGAEVVCQRSWADHQPITAGLLHDLLLEARKHHPEAWVTTEKDWVRLPPRLPTELQQRLYILGMEIDLGPQARQLEVLLEGVLR